MNEVNGSAEDIKPYLALIQQTIRERCTGTPQEGRLVPIDPQIELGVSFKSKSKNDVIKSHRIFNRGLGPNLNWGMNF